MAAIRAIMKTIFNSTALYVIINASSVQTLKIRAFPVEEIEKIHRYVLASQDSMMIL